MVHVYHVYVTGLFGRGIPPQKDMTVKYLVDFILELPSKLTPTVFSEMISYIFLHSPRKILWQQNHENAFIGQGISFAAPCPFNDFY